MIPNKRSRTRVAEITHDVIDPNRRPFDDQGDEAARAHLIDEMPKELKR
jgi:hypothetical protein